MKTLFKIFVTLFLINIFNLLSSIIFSIYCGLGLCKDIVFFRDLFIFSVLLLFPISGVLIHLLSVPQRKIKILWLINLK
jgi:hypothetical protein